MVGPASMSNVGHNIIATASKIATLPQLATFSYDIINAVANYNFTADHKDGRS